MSELGVPRELVPVPCSLQYASRSPSRPAQSKSVTGSPPKGILAKSNNDQLRACILKRRLLPLTIPASASPGLPVLSHQTDECVDLGGSDVFFQEFSIIVEQGGNSVFSQHVIANLLLHEAKLLGYVFLSRKKSEVSREKKYNMINLKTRKVATFSILSENYCS